MLVSRRVFISKISVSLYVVVVDQRPSEQYMYIICMLHIYIYNTYIRFLSEEFLQALSFRCRCCFEFQGKPSKKKYMAQFNTSDCFACIWRAICFNHFFPSHVVWHPFEHCPFSILQLPTPQPRLNPNAYVYRKLKSHLQLSGGSQRFALQLSGNANDGDWLDASPTTGRVGKRGRLGRFPSISRWDIDPTSCFSLEAPEGYEKASGGNIIV